MKGYFILIMINLTSCPFGEIAASLFPQITAAEDANRTLF